MKAARCCGLPSLRLAPSLIMKETKLWGGRGRVRRQNLNLQMGSDITVISKRMVKILGFSGRFDAQTGQ